MTDEETLLYYVMRSGLLATEVAILRSQLEQAKDDLTQALSEASATLNQAADTVRAMAWVVSQFVPLEDLHDWVERGALALLEASLENSGTEPETPGFGVD